jgi:hypothetical protein
MGGLGSQYFSGGLNALGQGAQTYGQAGNLYGEVYGGERGAATAGQSQMLQQGQENNQAFQRGAGQLFGGVLNYYQNRGLPSLPTGRLPGTTGTLPGGVYHPGVTQNRP